MRRTRWIFLLALLVASPAIADDGPPLLAGFGVADITPSKPVPLAGYAARFGKLSTGVHDPVKARAMVLESGETKIAIVSVDLLSVSRELKAAVVEAVKARGFTSANLLLAATNDHSGPGGLTTMPLLRPMTGPYDEALFRATVAKIAEAVVKADDAKNPASLSFGSVETEGLLRNRAVEGGRVGRTLDVLRVDGGDGKPMGLVVRFGAHPTILGADNLEISAEWPGAACDALEAAFPGTTALLLQGVEGDVSPAGGEGEGFDRVASYGRLVARAAAGAAGSAKTLAPKFECRDATVALPPTIAGALLGRGKGGLVPEDRVETEVQGITFGGGADAVSWFTVPGEPTMGAAPNGEHGYRQACVSCANDHVGYLCDRDSFFRAGYEASLDPVGPARANSWLERSLHRVGLAVHLVGPGWPRLPGHRVDGSADDSRERARDLLASLEPLVIEKAMKAGAGVALLPWTIQTGLPVKDLVIPLLVRASRSLQRHIPREYLDEMASVAEAAGVPYDSILLENTFLTIAEQTDPAALLSLPARCTNVALAGAATPLGEPIHATTLDWGMKEVLKARTIVQVFEPESGHPFVSVTWPGMVGTLRAMGAQGISVSEESIAAKDDTGMDGIPINFLLRDVVEHADSLDDAVKLVVEAPGTAGYHITIVDGHRRDARVVEVTARHHHVRKPVDGVLYGCDPTAAACFEGECDPSIPRTDRSSTARYAATRDLLGANTGRLGAWFARMHLHDAEGVWNEGTLLAAVFEPQVGRFHVSLGEALGVDASLVGPRWKTYRLEDLLSPAARERDRVPRRVKDLGPATEGQPQKMGAVVRIPVSFDSPVRSGVANNDRVNASLFLPAEGDAEGVVIQLPAWKERTLAGEVLVAMALASKGIATFLFPLPYQLDRAAPGVRSGEWTLSPDLSRTREAWLQGMADVACASAYLEAKRGFPPARQGVFGISLGGHVAADCYGAYPDRFRAGVFVLVGGDLHLALAGASTAPETQALRNRFAASDVTPDDVADLVKPLDPLTWADPARKDGVFLVGARQDPIVPPANVEALSRAYGGAEVLWIDGDHYAAIGKASEILAKAAEHLHRRFTAK